MDEEAIFSTALEKATPAQRDAFLDEACAGQTELRRKIDALLSAHGRAGDFLDEATAAWNACLPTSDAPAIERPGTQIGPYKLLEQIGEGGMGLVFMAEQTVPVKRMVALKVLKPGMDTRQVVARFEAERQALALMDHPNIARILDGGTTPTGRPYFVMELVRGVPITDFCDERRFTMRQRLELFVSVCQAVQHAHQKGIIHRDLKPSNVLVTLHDTAAVPKVIDFGVAKATGQRLTERTLFTHFAQMIGTPTYMSPEQAEMNALDVDTRSDIYSLGVLLYELLTGTTPFDKEKLNKLGYDEMRRIIREDEPPRPSERISTLAAEASSTVSERRGVDARRLGQSLRGELDWIVLKALEKDRNRRYESASTLAADVQRYLQDEPVEACPPSAMYRFRKFARRHKVALGVVGVVAMAVFGAMVVLAVSNVRISREQAHKEAALTEARKNYEASEANLLLARQAVDEIYTPVADQLAMVPYMQTYQRDVLQKTLRFYQEFAKRNSNDPVIRLETAYASYRVAEIQSSLGQPGQYEQAYRTVLASLQQLEHELPLDRKRRTYVALTVYRLGAVIAKAGRSQEAETTYRQALMMYAELAAEYPDHAAYSRQLAAVHTALGHLQQDQPYEAVQNIGKAIDVCKDLVKARPDDPLHRGALAHSYYILGCTLARTDELHPAEDAFRRAIAIFNEAPTRWDRSAYRAWRPLAEHELGKVLGSVGRTEEAETAHRAAIVLWKQLASQFPDIPLYRHNLANFYVALAKTLVQTGRHDEAAKFGRLAIEAAEKMVSECSDETDLQDQRETVRTFNNLGADLREAGELQGAEQICRKALELAKKLAADAADDSSAQYRLAETHYGLGVVLQRARRYREAADAYRAQLAVCDNLAAAHPADPDYQYHQATAGNYLGIALRSLPRETENALLQHRKAIELMDPLVMKFPDQVRYRSQLVRSHYALGLAHLVAGRRDEAAKSFRLALAASDGTPADRAYGRIQVASVHNDLAWLLSTRPDVKARDPKLAVESARKAVELDPKKGDYWNTLGAAEYRAGNCQETIAALEKAMKLRKGGDSFDWFFLAMAHWRLSNQEDARKWYHQAVEWMEKNQPKNAELRRFHAEASNILEIAEEKR